MNQVITEATLHEWVGVARDGEGGSKPLLFAQAILSQAGIQVCQGEQPWSEEEPEAKVSHAAEPRRRSLR